MCSFREPSRPAETGTLHRGVVVIAYPEIFDVQCRLYAKWLVGSTSRLLRCCGLALQSQIAMALACFGGVQFLCRVTSSAPVQSLAKCPLHWGAFVPTADLISYTSPDTHHKLISLTKLRSHRVAPMAEGRWSRRSVWISPRVSSRERRPAFS